jgi:hypothetical protein
VLKSNGKVIPGLYAAGNILASVMERMYPGYCSTFSPAMTFALIAADYATSGELATGVEGLMEGVDALSICIVTLQFPLYWDSEMTIHKRTGHANNYLSIHFIFTFTILSVSKVL